MKKQLASISLRLQQIRARLAPDHQSKQDPFLSALDLFSGQMKACRGLQTQVRKLSKEVGRAADSIVAQRRLQAILPQLHTRYSTLEKEFKRLELNKSRPAMQKVRFLELFNEARTLYQPFSPSPSKQRQPRLEHTTLAQLAQKPHRDSIISEFDEDEHSLIEDLMGRDRQVDQQLDDVIVLLDRLHLNARAMQEAIDLVRTKQKDIKAEIADNSGKVEQGYNMAKELVAAGKRGMCCMYLCVILLLGMTILLAGIVIFNKFVK